MGFFIGDNMSKNVQTGDVIFSEDGETLLYGWLDAEEAIEALEDFFDRQLPAFFYSLPRGSLKTATVA